MAPIRVLIQTCVDNADENLTGVLEQAREVRRETGNLQSEIFRGTEFPENIVRLELWESQQAFDAHWKMQLESAQRLGDVRMLGAPHHWGTPQMPRRHGQNGVEFYHYVPYVGLDGMWVPKDEADRSESVRWPGLLPVRFISQGTSDPATPGQSQEYYNLSRAEWGCLQFEPYRSVEFPENTLSLELWDSAQAIERHWISRLTQRKYGGGGMAGGGARPTPPERRYGQAGLEWYQQSYFELVGDVWMPEAPEQRMSTIHWA